KRRGVTEAQGDIIVVLDADCVPEPFWLAAIHRDMTAPGGEALAAVTCYYRFGPDLPYWGRVYNAAVRHLMIGPFRLLGRSLPFVLGGNVAFRRDCVGEGLYLCASGIAGTEIGLARRLRRRGRIR